MAAPYGESLYIYGMHDPGGEHLMTVDGQARGWVLVTEAIGADPNNQSGQPELYQQLADLGFGVIVRLNNAYGPDGTIPHSSKYQDFARRVANFVKNSPGAHIWLIGNEMNFEREQPRQPGSSEAEPITPRRYADCYRLCRQAVHQLAGHEKDQVIVGASAPWNSQTPYDTDPQGQYTTSRVAGGPAEQPWGGYHGDWIKYLTDICLAIGAENCDGLAIHAYTHGVDPDLIFSPQKMDAPFQQYHYHFYTYRDYMQAIPDNFRHLPVYLTEMDQDDPWEDANRGWVKNAYQEIDNWNKAGNQQIRAAILYRWPRADKWHIDGKTGVQNDFQEAVAQNYQWDPAVVAEIEARISRPPTEIPSRPGYRTRYISHNTSTTVSAGQTLTVNVTVQNVGSFTWVHGGANPFRLGFQWYTLAGQMVSFPSQLDFRTPLPADVPPDEAVFLVARLRTPDTPGTYHLRWDMIHELVTWFTTQGDQGLLVTPVTVNPAGVSPEVTPTPVQIQDVSASLAHHPSKQYPTRSQTAINRIIIHHTATSPTVSVQRIADYQVKNRDLPGITYHYCLESAGTIFQTQPMAVVSAHAGNHSSDSVGVCLIGDFTAEPPPQTQLDATALLLAHLVNQLNLSVGQIFGYSELVVTGSPGATWPLWKEPLLAQVSSLLAAEVPTPTPTEKPIFHYMLLWHKGPDNWAKWDLLGAIDYIERFPVTVGFSIEEAKSAQYVTIVGGTGGVPAEAEQILRAADCQVERLAGATETETRQILEQLAAEGRRFRTLQ